MILVSDDSKGPGGGRYSPLWEQALRCDQSPRRDIPSPYLGWRLRWGRLGRSGEPPVLQHPLHVCHVHGHEELEDNWNPARPGLRPRFLDPAYASQKFRMSFRVDRNTRCSNSSAARLSTAPRSAGTSSDWEPSAFETRAESIGMCRKRSFGT